jgi:hypothetical protein
VDGDSNIIPEFETQKPRKSPDFVVALAEIYLRSLAVTSQFESA